MARQRQVGLDRHRPARSTSAPVALGQALRPAATRDARRPDDGARRDALGRAVRVSATRDALGVDVDDGAAGQRRHAELLAALLALRERDGGKAVRTRSARLDEQDPRGARVDRAEVAAQRVAGELGDLARHLDAGRAAADDDERQPRVAAARGRARPRRPRRRARMRLRMSSAPLERLELRRVRAPLVVAEVRVVSSRRRRSACRSRARRAGAPFGRSSSATSRRSRSKPVTSASRTRALRCRLKTARSGVRDLRRRQRARSRPGRRAAGTGESCAGRRA